MNDEKSVLATIDLGGTSVLLVDSKSYDISTLIKDGKAALVTRPEGTVVYIESNEESTKIQVFESVVEATEELSSNPIKAVLTSEPKCPTYIFEKEALLRILHINGIVIEDLVAISVEYEDLFEPDELLQTVLKIAKIYAV